MNELHLVQRAFATKMMGMNRSEAARAKWARIIAAQARSGLSAAEFCRRHRIWASSFFAWKRRLGTSGTPAPAPPGFVEAKVNGVDDEHRVATSSPSLATVGGIAIELARGRRVTVVRGFDRQLLLDVIETLESRGHADNFTQRGVLEHADAGTRGVR